MLIPEDVLPNWSPFRDRKKRLLSTIFSFFRHVFDVEYVITEEKKTRSANFVYCQCERSHFFRKKMADGEHHDKQL